MKTFINNLKTDEEEIFVVMIMSYFGDALVGNSLFQNITRIYPKSKTVFIINKPYYEVAKYQKDVDEVFIYDKNNAHKGFWGIFKFVKDFPYKKVKYVFKMCKKERVDLLALLLRPEKIINYNDDISIPSHERYCNLLKQVTKEEIIPSPIVYNAENTIPEKFKNILTENQKYIAICTTASNIKRDMPIQTTIEVAQKLNKDKYDIILVGVGERAQNYASELEQNNCKCINLIDKTTIYELARILRNCRGLISVDTGTMHLGYANNVPTVCCFYNSKTIQGWAPDKTLYPHTILPSDNTPQKIYENCKEIIKDYYN